MSYLCPGKEAETVSDDFIALSDVTETVGIAPTEDGVVRINIYSDPILGKA